MLQRSTTRGFSRIAARHATRGLAHNLCSSQTPSLFALTKNQPSPLRRKKELPDGLHHVSDVIVRLHHKCQTLFVVVLEHYSTNPTSHLQCRFLFGFERHRFDRLLHAFIMIVMPNDVPICRQVRASSDRFAVTPFFARSLRQFLETPRAAQYKGAPVGSCTKNRDGKIEDQEHS